MGLSAGTRRWLTEMPSWARPAERRMNQWAEREGLWHDGPPRYEPPFPTWRQVGVGIGTGAVAFGVYLLGLNADGPLRVAAAIVVVALLGWMALGVGRMANRTQQEATAAKELLLNHHLIRGARRAVVLLVGTSLGAAANLLRDLG